MGGKKKKKDKEKEKDSKPSSRKKSSSKHVPQVSADPRGRALMELCDQEMKKLKGQISDNILDEVRQCEKETVLRSSERLSMNQVSYGREPADIDRESRDFELFQLKKRADELL